MTDDCEFLSCTELNDQALRLTYGLTMIKGKDGNTLCKHLGKIFEEEYFRRTGKVVALPSADGKTIRINYLDYDSAELKEAFLHFTALQRTFEKIDQPSAEFLGKIAALIFNAYNALGQTGHA